MNRSISDLAELLFLSLVFAIVLLPLWIVWRLWRAVTEWSY